MSPAAVVVAVALALAAQGFGGARAASNVLNPCAFDGSSLDGQVPCTFGTFTAGPNPIDIPFEFIAQAAEPFVETPWMNIYRSGPCYTDRCQPPQTSCWIPANITSSGSKLPPLTTALPFPPSSALRLRC
jgi:hypothetical protein